MFSKTHNLHFLTMTTNMNPTKTQRRPQNTSKTPQTRTASEEKTTKTKKFPRKPIQTHLIFPKPTIHSPLTLRPIRTQQNTTDTTKHVKNTRNKNRITPKTKEKPKSHRSTPKVPLNLPDVLQNPQLTISHHDDQHEPN